MYERGACAIQGRTISAAGRAETANVFSPLPFWPQKNLRVHIALVRQCLVHSWSLGVHSWSLGGKATALPVQVLQ